MKYDRCTILNFDKSASKPASNPNEEDLESKSSFMLIGAIVAVFVVLLMVILGIYLYTGRKQKLDFGNNNQDVEMQFDKLDIKSHKTKMDIYKATGPENIDLNFNDKDKVTK